MLSIVDCNGKYYKQVTKYCSKFLSHYVYCHYYCCIIIIIIGNVIYYITITLIL